MGQFFSKSERECNKKCKRKCKTASKKKKRAKKRNYECCDNPYETFPHCRMSCCEPIVPLLCRETEPTCYRYCEDRCYYPTVAPVAPPLQYPTPIASTTRKIPCYPQFEYPYTGYYCEPTYTRYGCPVFPSPSNVRYY